MTVASAERPWQDHGIPVWTPDEGLPAPVPDEPSDPAWSPRHRPAGVPRGRGHRLGTAARLAAFHAIVLAVVLGVVVLALVHQFSSSYEALAERGLVAESRSLAAQPFAAGESLQGVAAAYFKSHEVPSGTVIAIRDLAGQYVATGDWAAAFVRDPAIQAALAHPGTSAHAVATTIAGRSAELLTLPIIRDGKQIGSFVAATDLAPFRSDHSRVLALSLGEAGVALLAGVLSTFFLLRRALRTVGRITTAAREIGAGELERRLGDQGTDDEMGQLANTLDEMLDRIEGAMDSQRRLLSDVSHQLRTPLTVARGHLEVLRRTGLEDTGAVDQTVGTVLEELDHMRALVERLLLLGRSMEPDFVAWQEIDLRSFLADVHAAASVVADRDWQLPPIPDVVLRGDPANLRGAMLNLADNAVKATRPGDRIALSAALDERSGDLLVSVDDSGPGIPPASRASALARFGRGRGADGGQGLGLAIVKVIAEAHGGQVSIDDSPLGGCRVSIQLPARLLA